MLVKENQKRVRKDGKAVRHEAGIITQKKTPTPSSSFMHITILQTSMSHTIGASFLYFSTMEYMSSLTGSADMQ